jgi:hypothetical protein
LTSNQKAEGSSPSGRTIIINKLGATARLPFLIPSCNTKRGQYRLR